DVVGRELVLGSLGPTRPTRITLQEHCRRREAQRPGQWPHLLHVFGTPRIWGAVGWTARSWITFSTWNAALRFGDAKRSRKPSPGSSGQLRRIVHLGGR